MEPQATRSNKNQCHRGKVKAISFFIKKTNKHVNIPSPTKPLHTWQYGIIFLSYTFQQPIKDYWFLAMLHKRHRRSSTAMNARYFLQTNFSVEAALWRVMYHEDNSDRFLQNCWHTFIRGCSHILCMSACLYLQPKLKGVPCYGDTKQTNTHTLVYRHQITVFIRFKQNTSVRQYIHTLLLYKLFLTGCCSESSSEPKRVEKFNVNYNFYILLSSSMNL